MTDTKSKKYIVVSEEGDGLEGVDYIGVWDNTPANAKLSQQCYFAYLRSARGMGIKVHRRFADEIPADCPKLS